MCFKAVIYQRVVGVPQRNFFWIEDLEPSGNLSGFTEKRRELVSKEIIHPSRLHFPTLNCNSTLQVPSDLLLLLVVPVCTATFAVFRYDVYSEGHA